MITADLPTLSPALPDLPVRPICPSARSARFIFYSLSSEETTLANEDEVTSTTTPLYTSALTSSKPSQPKDDHKGERVSSPSTTTTTTSTSRKQSRTRQSTTSQHNSQHSGAKSLSRVVEPRTRRVQKADPLKGKWRWGRRLLPKQFKTDSTLEIGNLFSLTNIPYQSTIPIKTFEHV